MKSWPQRFKEWGKQGGKTRALRLSKARRKKIAKDAANARWHPAAGVGK